MRQLAVVIAARGGPFRRRLAQAVQRALGHVRLRTAASTVELGIRLGSESPDLVIVEAALPGLDLKRFRRLVIKADLRRTLFLCLTRVPLGRHPARFLAVRIRGREGVDWDRFRAALRRLSWPPVQ